MARTSKRPGIWVIERKVGKQWKDFTYLIDLNQQEAEYRLEAKEIDYPGDSFRLRFYTRTED